MVVHINMGRRHTQHFLVIEYSLGHQAVCGCPITITEWLPRAHIYKAKARAAYLRDTMSYAGVRLYPKSIEVGGRYWITPDAFVGQPGRRCPHGHTATALSRPYQGVGHQTGDHETCCEECGHIYQIKRKTPKGAAFVRK